MKKIDEMGSILTRLRGSKTKEEVACNLNISVSALSAYENGERVPRDEVKKRISDYYGKPVQYIFYNKAKIKENAANTDQSMSCI